MPQYDYSCLECGKSFVEFQRVADREKPTKTPCECGGKVVQCISVSGQFIMSGRYNWRNKLDPGFKDVLSKIKQHHPKAKGLDNSIDRT